MRKPALPDRARVVGTIVILAAAAACSESPPASGEVAGTVLTTGSGAADAAADGRERISLAREARQSRTASAARGEVGMARAGNVAGASAAAPAAPPAADVAEAAEAQGVRGAPLPAMDASGAMLVRQGQASIEVARVDDAVQRVRQTAGQFHGFVANTALSSGRDERRSANLEIRVPTEQFDALLASLNALGRVESVSAQVQDMSEEYVDLGARLNNARRVEARLVEMLATRTGKLSDVLTVEQELARVRMEAERYEARIRWIERKAALSSLTVTIHEKLPLIDTRRGPGPIAQALGDAWSRMLGVFAWFIAMLGLLIPLGLLIGAGYALARRLLRGRRPPGVSEA